MYFYERSMQLLKPQGALSFITSNKWYRSGYGKALRTYMRSHSKLMSIIDFGDEAVFTALAYPTIVIAQKRDMPLNPPPEADEVLALNWSKEQEVEQFPMVFSDAAFAVPQRELKADGWQLEPPAKRRLLQRMRLAGTPLGEYCKGHFYYGLKTGLNEAFVVDGTRRAELIATDQRSAEVIKPYLRGRDVKRWSTKPQDLWVIFIPWHFPLHEDASITEASAQAEKLFRKNYPAIYEHLRQFMPQLKSRDQTETGIRYEWYALQRFREFWREFERPKIIYPDIYLHQSFSWDSQGYYPANTCYFIPTDQKWLCGLLNAPAIEWFYEQIANRIQGGYLRAFSDRMQTVPIPPASLAQQSIIESLVTAVIEIDDPKVEQLINGLVYELFFPDDLRAAGIRLFDACEREHITRLATLQGAALQTESAALAERIFSNNHPIYAMLFDLQALDVVRIIEARD